MLPDAAQIPAAVAAAYLLGATPFSWLTGRLAGGVDIRQHGSGNAGATNCARVVGQGRTGVTAVVFVLVFGLDAAKGWFAVFAAQQWLAPVAG
ncbi:MAG: glycerol-3-phosphate acyltransferase, partial [Planctomycetota bacterium]